MRGLLRLPEPKILIDKKAKWLSDFLANGKARPDSSKYAHSSIKADLMSISFHKCFYCETLLKGEPKEVDHHIEVSVDKNLAFEWTNLYLACDVCNNKIAHDTISINDALNPCIDDDNFIQLHLTFKDELIQPKSNSNLGLRTIQKYRLNDDALDMRRSRLLNQFYRILVEIKDQQIQGGRSSLTKEENDVLNSFIRIDKPYSLMFIALFKTYGL